MTSFAGAFDPVPVLLAVAAALLAAAVAGLGAGRWRGPAAGRRLALLVLLAGAVATTLVVTLGPVTEDGPGTPDRSGLNLVPFRDITAVLRSGDLHRALLQLGGNVLLFLPVGLLLTLVLRRPGPAVLLGVLLSAVEESLQRLVGRAVDVDDVLLNGTGVVLGALVALLGRRLVRGLVRGRSRRRARRLVRQADERGVRRDAVTDR